MELRTQAEVEQVMYYGGVKRANAIMENAEKKGRAVNNPYASEVLSEFVLPVAEAIRADISETIDAKRPGRKTAFVTLLQDLDPEAVAFLAVRTCINAIMQSAFYGGNGVELSTGAHRIIYRVLTRMVGTTIHNELVLAQLAEELPDLYHILTEDMGRRLSKDDRYRMTIYRSQAKKNGITFAEWGIGSRDQVGIYLVNLLELHGMISIEPQPEYVQNTDKMLSRAVILENDVYDRINQVKEFVAASMPVYGPCVEPPLDWKDITGGGYHTRELQRTHRYVVRHRWARTMASRDMPIVLEAVNALQRTAWQVNEKILDLVLEIPKYFAVGDIPSGKATPPPEKPAWLDDMPKDRDAWPEEMKEEMADWKRRKNVWYTARRLEASKYSRFYSATRAAEMFRGYPAIYFVYFADFRGRLYPMTYGMSPQGSDLQKALIRFAEGKPVDTPDAIRWFHIQGANKWGYDKATLDDRHKWVVEHQEQILAMADDPLSNTEWKDADKPLQFLAWAFEYRDWVRDTTGAFRSHIPVAMDGSCNGLQHLSALFRDEVGGAATNLVPGPTQQDIYGIVGLETSRRLAARTYEDPASEAVRRMWVEHGVPRSAVKRPVMTTPYGVTRGSATRYVVSDFLAEGKGPPFDKKQWNKAATVLMDSTWEAIGGIVVKGRAAMDWLKSNAAALAKEMAKTPDEDAVLSWTTPSGFTAFQTYFEHEEHRINTKLCGPASIRLIRERTPEGEPKTSTKSLVVSETAMPAVSDHARGLAPNFVHSMDAAHMHLTAAAAARKGITSLAMIHDDYGTHAADAQMLYQLIREEFVKMYENHDPIADLIAKYPQMTPPPSKGTLDIRGVLDSQYFFA